jgi:hypothetical protein
MNQSMGKDSYSKNIQNQIANKQKELQNLAKAEDMSVEEKLKKKQEIEKEIADLTLQLRQHQIEQRNKQQQQKNSSKDDSLAASKSKQTAQKEGTGISQASMKAIISADSSMKQAQVQGSAATKLNGRAGVLEAEIKQDKAREVNTERKEAELSDIQDKIQTTVSSQMSTLSDAIETINEAASEERDSEKTEAKKTEQSKDSRTIEKDDSDDQLQTDNSKNTEKIATAAGNDEKVTTSQLINYTSVDILL